MALCNIDEFSDKFIKKRWHDRFIHEFKKRPRDFIQRCTCHYNEIFKDEALRNHRPESIKNGDLIVIIKSDGGHETMEWGFFINSYQKHHNGFIAISVSGEFGYLETHEAHEKDAIEYFIY